MTTTGQLKHKLKVRVQDLRLRYHLADKPVRIVVGASGVYQDGWYPTDIENINLLVRRDWEKYFRPNSLDAILAEHVWEHLTPEEAVLAARNCHVFLKPSGYLRVAVPDGYHPSTDYIRAVEPGGTGEGSLDHFVLFNYESITELFEAVGFEVRLLEYFDENRVFHSIPWNPSDGMVTRSSRFDDRNINGELVYTSLIIDAVKR